MEDLPFLLVVGLLSPTAWTSLKVASFVVLESLVWVLQGLCDCGRESALLWRKGSQRSIEGQGNYSGLHLSKWTKTRFCQKCFEYPSGGGLTSGRSRLKVHQLIEFIRNDTISCEFVVCSSSSGTLQLMITRYWSPHYSMPLRHLLVFSMSKFLVTVYEEEQPYRF